MPPDHHRLIECTNCGAELPDNAAFCLRCGQRITEDVEPEAPIAQPTGVPAASRPRAGYPELEGKSGRGRVILLVGLALVTLAIAGAVFAILSRGSSGSSEPSEVQVFETSSPVQTLALVASGTHTPLATCGQIQAGCEAVVGNVAEVGLRIRESPGTTAPAKDTLRNAAIVCITGPSAQADGLTWWPVRVDLTTGPVEGWSAERDPNSGEGPYLTATGKPCG